MLLKHSLLTLACALGAAGPAVAQSQGTGLHEKIMPASPSRPAIAAVAAQLAGTWKLVSFHLEFQATGERKPMASTGYLILTPEGRLMAVIANEGRRACQSDSECAALLRSMVAYSGVYRVEGEKFVTQVDVSWNEAWTGSEQVRFFKLDENRLDIVGDWAPAPLLPGSPRIRPVIRWERTG